MQYLVETMLKNVGFELYLEESDCMHYLSSKMSVVFAFFVLFLFCQVSLAGGVTELKEPADVIKLFKEQGADALQFPLPNECSWCPPLEVLTLNYAVETNEIKVVEALFAKGGITDAKKQCQEAVKLACKLAREEILKILIANGADIYSDSYPTPAINAILEDHNGEHREIVKMLIAAGANVNARDYNGGSTLLMKVTGKGWTDVVAMILDRNVEVNAVSDNGATAMTYIGGDEASSAKILEMLFSHGANANIGNSPLFMATFYPGYYEVAKILLDHSIAVDARDSSGATPLMMAVFMGREKTVKLLIAKGADVHHKDEQGVTALMYSPRAGNFEIIKMLFEQGADINEVSNQGCTPLMSAACYDHPEVVTLFLDRGAKIDQVDADGKTALMYAVEYGRSKTLKVLLDRGAKKNFKDWAGQTALAIAKQKGHKDCVDLLESYSQKEPEDTPIEISDSNRFSTMQHLEDNPIMQPILIAQKDIAKLVATGRIDYGIDSEMIERMIYTRGHAIAVLSTNNDVELVSFLRLIAVGSYDDEFKNKAKGLALIVHRSGIKSLSSEDREQLRDIIFYLIRKGIQDIVATNSAATQPEIFKEQLEKGKQEL